MILLINSKKIKLSILILILAALISSIFIYNNPTINTHIPTNSQGFIKWVDFGVPYSVMEKTLKLDIESHASEVEFNWIELLAYLGAKYGGNFSNYKATDLDNLIQKLKTGETIQSITANMKYYNYFFESYNAILRGFVGEYEIETKSTDTSNEKFWQSNYGLKVFSPIAKGYAFNHYDDFGNQRSFGFKRKHLGNDLMGNIGTPIIAVESGIVEIMGWNIYGGWRIGIRSFDKKRYYYYAHLRKGQPFHKELHQGKEVKAGDVIGYLGMTGYSTKENTNNIKIPHLHFGIQIIFDESQKDGVNQIWIDAYNIVELLQKNKSAIYKDPISKDFTRTYDIKIPEINDD